MASTYYFKLDNPSNEPSLTQDIQVGNRTIRFQFQWAVVSEEQFNLILQYVRTRAKNEPILRNGGAYDRTYNWYEYYISLVGVNLTEWLDTDPEIPIFIQNEPISRKIELLNNRITEAKALKPAVDLYTDILKWQFTASSVDTENTVGYVQPGGWYRNQDNTYAFRFVTNLDYVDRTHLSEVYIVFEVYNE